MSSIDQIYQDGRHYDLLFPHAQDTPHLWLELGDQFGDPILELACGTGRIAVPLAQRGHVVTGIDLSESMLVEAVRKAAMAHVNLNLQVANMYDFDLSEKYSLILLAANALCHLLDVAAFERCMACVRRHLRPNGRFVVEVFVPNLHFLTVDPSERSLFAEYDDPDGKGIVTVTQSAEYDAAAQIRYNHTFYKFPDRADEVAGELPMRMYFPAELDALFKYNGFTIEQKWGAFDRRPFDSTSSMQLFVLQALETASHTV